MYYNLVNATFKYDEKGEYMYERGWGIYIISPRRFIVDEDGGGVIHISTNNKLDESESIRIRTRLKLLRLVIFI